MTKTRKHHARVKEETLANALLPGGHNSKALLRVTHGDLYDGAGVILSMTAPQPPYKVGDTVRFRGGKWLPSQEHQLPMVYHRAHRANLHEALKVEVADGIREALLFDPVKMRRFHR